MRTLPFVYILSGNTCRILPACWLIKARSILRQRMNSYALFLTRKLGSLLIKIITGDACVSHISLSLTCLFMLLSLQSNITKSLRGEHIKP